MRSLLVVSLQLLILFPCLALPRKGSFGEELEPAGESRLKATTHTNEERELEESAPLKTEKSSLVTQELEDPLNGQPEETVERSQPYWIPRGGEDLPPLGVATGEDPRPSSRSEGSVCKVNIRRQDTGSGRLLEVSGVLTGYESAFLEDVRWSSWREDDLDLFGLCAETELSSSLPLLKHIVAHLADPKDHRLIVLHLEEVKWGREIQLMFQVRVEEDSFSMEDLKSSLLVFYPGEKGHLLRKHRVTFTASGAGQHQKQAVCLSGGTRYLPVRAASTDWSFSQGQLRFTLMLQLWYDDEGPAMTEQVQQWLFGADDKCFTRMTPALFLLLKRKCLAKEKMTLSLPLSQTVGVEPDAVSYSNLRLPADISIEVSRTAHHGKKSPLGHTDAFLEAITRFIGKVLGHFEEQSDSLVLPLDLDNQTMDTFTSNPLNISEKMAVEWLVESDEPLVFFFPKGSQSLLERHFVQGKLEGKLLDKLMDKLQALVDELMGLPVIRDNAQLLRDLLDHCHGSFNLGFLPGAGGAAHEESSHGHKKLHSLLLLKALQSVRAYWQKKSTLSRQNRSASSKPFCRLKELGMSLRFNHEKPTFVFPPNHVFYNCEGPCNLPQSTVSETNTHVILLIQMRDRGATLGRSPCCVPEKYGPLFVGFPTEDGILFKNSPKVNPEECGCR